MPSAPHARTPHIPRSHRTPGTRWSGYGGTLCAVAAGTALVGAQAYQLGPWLAGRSAVTFAHVRALDEGGLFGDAVTAPATGGTDATGTVGGTAPSEGGGTATLWLTLLVGARRLGLFDQGGTLLGVSDLVWPPRLLALLCVAGVLTALAGTAGAPRRRGAVFVPLLAAGALAVQPAAVRWLFSGQPGPLYALLVALLVRLLVTGIRRNTLLTTGHAVGAGLLAAAVCGARPDAVGFLAAYPLVLLLRLPRGTLPALSRGLVRYAVSCAVPWAALLCWRGALLGHRPALVPAGDPGPAGAVVVPLLASALLALALTRGGRPRKLCGALGRCADRPVVRTLATLLTLLGVVLAPLVGPTQQNRPGLCYVAERYGAMFEGYARHLGLARAVVAVDAPVGAMPVHEGGVRLLDLRSPDPWAAGPWVSDPWVSDRDGRAGAPETVGRRAAARAYVLERTRPEFVHLHADGTDRLGLTPERLAAHGYRPLLHAEHGTDYVHRSAVTSVDALSDVRDWAHEAVRRLRVGEHTGEVCAHREHG
ncbi:hypothetical protein AN216_13365 [Streptomyces oceani]|uniref:Glycosyltransferase RgtA/B/C/D-like domain-containing protein n=1 Tax=Streptomyces oceani TaxID=1075402 RepID=A0A1E7KGH8_9ACTN|nr:hypothetical protein AN216_13365 [Streptomyces oceani]